MDAVSYVVHFALGSSQQLARTYMLWAHSTLLSCVPLFHLVVNNPDGPNSLRTDAATDAAARSIPTA
eukprot:6473382-Amphidinium_carterae.1